MRKNDFPMAVIFVLFGFLAGILTTYEKGPSESSSAELKDRLDTLEMSVDARINSLVQVLDDFPEPDSIVTK